MFPSVAELLREGGPPGLALFSPLAVSFIADLV